MLTHILIYGVINSVMFVLLSVGFSLVYGVSRIPNFAHGALYVLVGFLTWSLINQLHLPYFAAVLLALAAAGCLGALMYRLVLIRVRGMPTSEIIASFALGIMVLEGLRLQGIGGFQGFIGPFYVLAPFLDGSFTLGGVSVDYQRLIVAAGGLAMVACLWLFTHHTKTGLSLRAIAQDEQAAMMLGIDSDRTATTALALGSALAGLAAVVILPLGNITPEAGYVVLIQAIAVCIIGGLGSWLGAVLASFILGFSVIITTTLFGAMWQSVVLVGAIIVILVLRPSGLFGMHKELEERV